MPKPSLRHPDDVALGKRIRMCRLAADVTQETLARDCGVTFQQIQKYERGLNRVSYSRLVEIAKALGLTAVDVIAPLSGKKGMAGDTARLLAFLADDDTTRLLLWMSKCKQPKMRAAVLTLLETIA